MKSKSDDEKTLEVLLFHKQMNNAFRTLGIPSKYVDIENDDLDQKIKELKRKVKLDKLSEDESEAN